MENSCPLCATPSSSFFKDDKHHFLSCPNCKGIFRDQQQLIDRESEEKRYLHHRNDMDDKGYYRFIQPLINEVKQLVPKGACGLDFGCGHTPVLSNYLLQEQYNMAIYDPLFFNDLSVLERSYDFIVCCEVIEHFYAPDKEFKKLHQTIAEQGFLICKTHLFNDDIDFGTWYYKNDPSHVFIYQQQTLEWIKEQYAWHDLRIKDRLIIFSK